MYTVLIPAYNEEKTVRRVVRAALASKDVGQVIVVNDGSSDETATQASLKSNKLEIITHNKNMGKGAAVRTGLAHAKYECIVFIDADLVSMTSDNIYALAEPIIENTADFVKASFTRARGRVTEIAVKPMMQILFPDNYFEQPISGQFAGRLSFLKTIRIVEDWGLDIGILLDALEARQRVTEVYIGELKHKKRTEHSLAQMSEQVLRTMIQKAGLFSTKYKLVIFNFDETIIKNYCWKKMFDFLGKTSEYIMLQEEISEQELLPLEIYTRYADILKDVPLTRLADYCDSLELRTYALDVINHLKKRNYKVGIVGVHFHPIMQCVAGKLGVELCEGIQLKTKGKKLSGEMQRSSVKQWFSNGVDQGYKNAVTKMSALANSDTTECIALASSLEAAPLLKTVGFSIAYRYKDKQLSKIADKTISILPELLVLVE